MHNTVNISIKHCKLCNVHMLRLVSYSIIILQYACIRQAILPTCHSTFFSQLYIVFQKFFGKYCILILVL